MNKNHLREIDFQNRNGFSVDIWGPAAWHFLRCVAFNYPVDANETRKLQYMSFMKSLCGVLPCGLCRESYKRNFTKLRLDHPDTYKTRRSFCSALYALEETINKEVRVRDKTKLKIPQYTETHDLYTTFRAQPGEPDTPCQNKKRVFVVVVNKKDHEGELSLQDLTSNSAKRIFARCLNKQNP